MKRGENILLQALKKKNFSWPALAYYNLSSYIVFTNGMATF